MKQNILLWLCGLTLIFTPFTLSAADQAEKKEPMYKRYENRFPKPAPAIQMPQKWTLSNKATGTMDNGYFELIGKNDFTQWTSENFSVCPGYLYQVRLKGACTQNDSGDCVPIGFDFASRDYSNLPEGEEQWLSPVTMIVPDGRTSASLKLAQWMTKRTYRFSDISVRPVTPLYQALGKATNSSKTLQGDYLLLGNGESLIDGVYHFSSFSNVESGNFDRPIEKVACSFNTDRWALGQGSEVVYHFKLRPFQLNLKPEDFLLPPIEFEEATISVAIQYYVAGRAILEASIDGKTWKEVGSTEKLANISAKINAETFGKSGKLPEFYVRIRGDKGANGREASFQVHRVGVDGKTNCRDFNGYGNTDFLEYSPREDEAKYRTLPFFVAPDGSYVYVLINESDKPIKRTRIGNVSFDGEFVLSTPDDWKWKSLNGSDLVEAGGHANIFSLQYLKMNGGKQYKISFPFESVIVWRPQVSAYSLQNYTSDISGMTGKGDQVSVTWCPSDHKVPKTPKTKLIHPASQIVMESAKNDFESFQLVLCPNGNMPDGLKGLSVTASDLTGDSGQKIPASEIELRYAWYHFVKHPTDRTGTIGYWPDALVPINKGADGRGAPLNINRGDNLPVWVTVHVPLNATSDLYRGTVALKNEAGSWSVTVPYTLKVHKFAIPVKNRLETAYGLSEGRIAWYHNCKTLEERRAVFELYLKNFGEHRISPYHSTPFDSYYIKWHPESNPPTAEIANFDGFAKEMNRVMDKYHFTNFRLDTPGMGGGTYEERYEPQIGKFGENTPEYKAMFADMGKKLEKGLSDAGLLKAAYIYWFDEPEPKDYDFVAQGFARLKKNMPGIARMLTEEPSDDFCKSLDEKGGNVDIWCPVSNCFSKQEAQKRMDKNERFWWYVCTGPKAPFCTLFIDHPATELRVWHWQTFERKIKGTLVWESNYWTSGAAYPQQAQNPYLDPMGYVSGGAGSPVAYWGNGDGRFVYPPLAAATPGMNDGKPVIEPPVSSIRWEMIREGVEDYEMLVILSELVEKNKSKLSAEDRETLDSLFDFKSITKSMTQFTTTPKPIYAKRHQIMEWIDRLQK